MVLYQLKTILHNFIRKSMNNEQRVLLQEDEIDLRELWRTLVKRKVTIFIVAFMTTLAATVYALTATPVYSGNILISVGSIILNSEQTNDKATIIQTIENTVDLKEIILQEMNSMPKKPMVDASFPKGSATLITISCEGSDKLQIEQRLQEASAFVLSRHQLRAAFYKESNAKIAPSSIIGKITVSQNPIKPKKQLIISVGFISGLMLGIFIAFFLEFIGARRNR